MSCSHIFLYLCTRVHAVHALRGGCEGVGQTYWNSVLQRFVFGSLNLGNSNKPVKNIADEDATGWYTKTNPLVCRGSCSLKHTLRVHIYHGVGVIFCQFTGKVFLGPKRQTGRVTFHAFFVSIGQPP